MIWEIAKKEMMHHLLSFRFTAAAVLCVLVILTSCVAMYRQYEGRAQDYILNAPRAGEARASIPPTLMSVFAWGLEDVTGRTVTMGEGIISFTIPLRSFLNLFDTFFPTFDLSYVVRIIGALVAMGFAFDAVCGEGRSGTLALMLAAGASRRGVLLGKLAGGFPVIAILFFGPMMFGLMILALFFSAPLTLESLARTLLWGAGAALYLFCFFCLGLLISSVITTPKVSLMACLVLWTLLIFVFPGIVVSLNRIDTNIQTPAQFERDNFWSIVQIEVMNQQKQNFDEAVQNLFRRRETRANEMIRLTGRALTGLRMLPGAAYLDLSANLSGTGISGMPHYYSAMQRYVGAVQAARRDSAEIPSFAFSRSSLGACAQSSITDVISLVLWSAVAFWASIVALSHYDVRVKEVGQI